jgi:hypothetical protein
MLPAPSYFTGHHTGNVKSGKVEERYQQYADGKF